VFLSERPSTATLIGGVIVLAAVLVQSVRQAPEHEAEERVPERRLHEGALRP
jgi:drug/metabolite transporter (DMT)-like permease